MKEQLIIINQPLPILFEKSEFWNSSTSEALNSIWDLDIHVKYNITIIKCPLLRVLVIIEQV